MREEKKVEQRLRDTLQQCFNTTIIPALLQEIENMGGIKVNSLTVDILPTGLLPYRLSTVRTPTAELVRIYNTHPQLSLTLNATIKGISPTITAQASAECSICLAERWGEIISLRIHHLQVLGSEIKSTPHIDLIPQRVSIDELKHKGRDAFASKRKPFSEESMRKIAQYLAMHLTPLHRLISIWCNKIGQKIVTTLSEVPPFRIEKEYIRGYTKPSTDIECRISKISPSPSIYLEPIDSFYAVREREVTDVAIIVDAVITRVVGGESGNIPFRIGVVLEFETQGEGGGQRIEARLKVALTHITLTFRFDYLKMWEVFSMDLSVGEEGLHNFFEKVIREINVELLVEKIREGLAERLMEKMADIALKI